VIVRARPEDLDGLAGVHLEHRPEADRLEVLIPKLVRPSLVVEVSGVSRRAAQLVASLDDFEGTDAADLDEQPSEPLEMRDGVGIKVLSSTAPGADRATASIAITAARPSCWLWSTVSGRPRVCMSVSLISSFAIRPSPSSGADAEARVLFPEPGGPATKTNSATSRAFPPAHVGNPSSRSTDQRP
jgi:hypothetical protein